ncbi:MAG: hypothetical protein ACE5K7_01885, partial [Phycisphaerae bacterium]
MTIHCPHCGQALSVGPEQHHLEVRCRHCGWQFIPAHRQPAPEGRSEKGESGAVARLRRLLLGRVGLALLGLIAAGALGKGLWWLMRQAGRATGMGQSFSQPAGAHVVVGREGPPRHDTRSPGREVGAQTTRPIRQDRLAEAKHRVGRAEAGGTSEAEVARLPATPGQARQARVLSQLRAQVQEALSRQEWAQANDLIDRALALSGSVATDGQWRQLRESARRGPLEILLNSSRAALEKGAFQRAVTEAESAVALDPNDPEARKWLGMVLQRVGAGLLVEGEPADAVVEVGGRRLGTVGAVVWGLPEGSVAVRIDAEQFMPSERIVNLTLG